MLWKCWNQSLSIKGISKRSPGGPAMEPPVFYSSQPTSTHLRPGRLHIGRRHILPVSLCRQNLHIHLVSGLFCSRCTILHHIISPPRRITGRPRNGAARFFCLRLRVDRPWPRTTVDMPLDPAPNVPSLQDSPHVEIKLFSGFEPESSVSGSPSLIVLIHKLFSHPLINFGHGMDG